MQFPSHIPHMHCGIYSITCQATGSMYVGSTSRSFYERWNRHIHGLIHKYHDNPLLQVDWNTYGANAFLFSVVETLTLLETIRDREKYWIDHFSQRYLFIYNLANIVRSTKPLPPLVWLICHTCHQSFPVRSGDAERRKPLYCCRPCWRNRLGSTEERFWSKVDRSGGPDACWPWLGKLDGGYGWFSMPGAGRIHASRFSYELTHGPLQAKEVVRHTCDNPPCVNPTHLIKGSSAQNTQDAKERGRLAKGSQHGLAKLVEPDIPIIRALKGKATATAVGEQFHVNRTTISSIWNSQTWSQVP